MYFPHSSFPLLFTFTFAVRCHYLSLCATSCIGFHKHREHHRHHPCPLYNNPPTPHSQLLQSPSLTPTLYLYRHPRPLLLLTPHPLFISLCAVKKRIGPPHITHSPIHIFTHPQQPDNNINCD
ncbi:hypothetical protein BKA57DRAFT_444131 [Linnemannia elongata]|nr:hypothetical protein BKA57DRAFT_444131 [Linnemannia elongata]